METTTQCKYNPIVCTMRWLPKQRPNHLVFILMKKHNIKDSDHKVIYICNVKIKTLHFIYIVCIMVLNKTEKFIS